MELKFTVQTKVQRPVEEVFDAVYNPETLSKYFTTGGATGPLDAGTTVMWSWHDYPGSYPVHVKESVKNERIVFEWGANTGDYDTRTEMTFEALNDKETLIKITESGWTEDEQGLKDSYGNCHGWMHMACCLKAWVEHGINLREGAFEGLYEAEQAKTVNSE